MCYITDMSEPYQPAVGSERELFERALELDDRALEAFLAEVAETDRSLADRVQRLVEADRAETAPPLEQGLAAARSSLSALQNPQHIGPYRILERIGEGGMGVVYLAGQSRPVSRQVAIKVVKVGMDTAELLARFDSERQALARMNHPNIAGIFDAGATDEGRPYFVMEYVPGQPITQFSDHRSLGIDQRLSLFLEACDAIAHAHQKGVIHRDIKPENILITEADEKPQAKVIDFGVAKSVDNRLTDNPTHTRIGAVIGTLDYMSPEQASPQPGGVDTRSDVYSLGAVLYELLAGVAPGSPLRQTGDPPFVALSGRIQSLSPPEIQDLARTRQTSPADLRDEVARELTWITSRALASNPADRYQSVRELAADIRSFLQLEPIAAGPDTLGYRIMSFARRNRIAVTATTIVVLALGAGLAMSVAGFLEANRERDSARLAQQESEAVTQFLSDMLSAADPAKEGRDVTVREVLDNAAPGVRADFADNPLLAARLLGTIGETYMDLGLFEQADSALSESLALYAANVDESDPAYISALFNRGRVYQRMGRYDDTEVAYRTVYVTRLAAQGEDHPATIDALNNLGILYALQGRYMEALEARQRVHRQRVGIFGPAAPETLTAKNNLALSFSHVGRYAEAMTLFEEAVAGRTRLHGHDHPDTLMVRSNLAGATAKAGRPREAVTLLESVVRDAGRVYGEQDWRTLISRHSLARAMGKSGLSEAAEAEFLAVIRARERVLGRNHPETLIARVHYAEFLLSLERPADAEPQLRTAVSAAVLSLPPDSPLLAQYRADHARALLALGHIEEAAAALEAAYPVLEGAVERGSVAAAEAYRQVLIGLATVSRLGGDTAEAARFQTELAALGEPVD